MSFVKMEQRANYYVDHMHMHGKMGMDSRRPAVRVKVEREEQQQLEYPTHFNHGNSFQMSFDSKQNLSQGQGQGQGHANSNQQQNSQFKFPQPVGQPHRVHNMHPNTNQSQQHPNYQNYSAQHPPEQRNSCAKTPGSYLGHNSRELKPGPMPVQQVPNSSTNSNSNYTQGQVVDNKCGVASLRRHLANNGVVVGKRPRRANEGLVASALLNASAKRIKMELDHFGQEVKREPDVELDDRLNGGDIQQQSHSLNGSATKMKNKNNNGGPSSNYHPNLPALPGPGDVLPYGCNFCSDRFYSCLGIKTHLNIFHRIAVDDEVEDWSRFGVKTETQDNDSESSQY